MYIWLFISYKMISSSISLSAAIQKSPRRRNKFTFVLTAVSKFIENPISHAIPPVKKFGIFEIGSSPKNFKH